MCNKEGSKSEQCDDVGKCTCKAYVEGDDCNKCVSKYFGFPNCKGRDLICKIMTII